VENRSEHLGLRPSTQHQTWFSLHAYKARACFSFGGFAAVLGFESAVVFIINPTLLEPKGGIKTILNHFRNTHTHLKLGKSCARALDGGMLEKSVIDLLRDSSSTKFHYALNIRVMSRCRSLI